MDERVKIYEDDYQNLKSCLYPLIKISCQFGNQRVEFNSLADTGCDSGFVMLDRELELIKKEYSDFDLGEKVNAEPISVTVADGHQVAADVYFIRVELSGEERVIDLVVIHPENIIGTAAILTTDKISEICPLIRKKFSQSVRCGISR